MQKQLIHVEHIREEFSQKWFKVHLQKSLLYMPDKTPGSLVILSFGHKETIFDLPAVPTQGAKESYNPQLVQKITTPPQQRKHHRLKSLKCRINANITTLKVSENEQNTNPITTSTITINFSCIIFMNLEPHVNKPLILLMCTNVFGCSPSQLQHQLVFLHLLKI